MITPDFSNYSGSQAIVSSDRVINYSKSDGVYLFGKATIGLSSQGTVNIDSKEAILLDSDTIELGHRASELGNQVILGNRMVGLLKDVLYALRDLSGRLEVASGTAQEDTGLSLSLISDGGISLSKTLDKAIKEIDNTLSKTTYTT